MQIRFRIGFAEQKEKDLKLSEFVSSFVESLGHVLSHFRHDEENNKLHSIRFAQTDRLSCDQISDRSASVQRNSRASRTSHFLVLRQQQLEYPERPAYHAA